MRVALECFLIHRIYKGPAGKLFIADTGNHRVIILDKDMTKVIKVIKDFDNNKKGYLSVTLWCLCIKKRMNYILRIPITIESLFWIWILIS